jgi:hypothetical protein
VGVGVGAGVAVGGAVFDAVGRGESSGDSRADWNGSFGVGVDGRVVGVMPRVGVGVVVAVAGGTRVRMGDGTTSGVCGETPQACTSAVTVAAPATCRKRRRLIRFGGSDIGLLYHQTAAGSITDGQRTGSHWPTDPYD